jgi:phosphatidylglycerophosphate synthase
VAFLGIEATPVVPYATVKGNLSVEVSPKAGKVGAAMAPGGIPVSADGGVDVELPLHVTAPALPGSWSVGTKASPASPASPDAGGQPRPETPVRARATATKVADTADRVRVQAQLPTRPDGPVALSWHSKPPAWMADEAKTPSSAATAPAAAAPGSASQARQARPTLGELRAVTQPASTMDRRNAEHWLARLFLRKVSLRVTALLIRTPVSANALTGLMIVVGLLAAVTVGLVPGWFGIVLTFLLIQAYFLLDLCDGEVARWRRTTSITGVYLDRVGHYLVEAAILSGIGLRAGDHELGGWSTLGVATGLCAVLVKAETDLVDVARVRAGASAAAEAAVELRSSALGGLRRAAQVLKVHQLTGALEVSFLLLVAMVVDLAAGGLTGTRILAVVLAAIAGVMVVVHLASILLSRRLE